MFSGLVMVTMLLATGRVIGTDLITTGMVIRKMIKSTSMMSTNGVVLMVELISSSSSPPLGKLIDMTNVLSNYAKFSGLALGRQQIGLEFVRKGAELLGQPLVAANQEVVAEHRRHRDRETHRRHDERLTHRTGDLVNRGLAGNTDGGQRVQSAPHRAEQSDERGGRTHRSEEGNTAAKPRIFLFDCALQGHLHPVGLAEHAALARHCLLTALRHVAEHVVLTELVDTFFQVPGGPEFLFRRLGLAHEPSLLPIFGEEDVPGAERHDRKKAKHAFRHEITACP